MHVQDDELKLYSLGCVPESQTSAISSHLAECEICRDKLAETATYISQLAELSRLQARQGEKRSGLRIPAADPASMVRRLYPSPASRVDIKVVDVSGGGLGLLVPEFLAPGVLIEIQLKGLIMAAEVRYCVTVGERVGKFHAGVEIRDIFSSGSTKSPTPPGNDSKIPVQSDPQAVRLRADSHEEYTMEDRETRQEWAWAVGVIASILVLAFAAYLSFFLGEWGLALLVITLTVVLGAAIVVYRL